MKLSKWDRWLWRREVCALLSDLLVCILLSDMRLVEAESSSTLELTEPRLELHCFGHRRAHPVWYRDDEQLQDDGAQTLIRYRYWRQQNTVESILAMSADLQAQLVGDYQCRDVRGYHGDSDVLRVRVVADRRVTGLMDYY